MLVVLVTFAWTQSMSRALGFLLRASDSCQKSTSMTATTSTVASNWWPPSSSMTSREERSGIVPGSSRDYHLRHQRNGVAEDSTPDSIPDDQQQHFQESSWLPNDPLAAATLRNTIHQAACNSLIYENRWKFCLAVWDDRMLDWLIGTACPGNFWTPRTYVILATGDDNIDNDNHPVWQEWEGSKTIALSLNGSPSEGVRKLRSLASRILPRLCNSGRRETDLPVFDLVVVTSSQLQGLLNQVAAEARMKVMMEAEKQDQQSATTNKRGKKRKKQKIQDVPWVVPLSSDPLPRIMLSLHVLQAAKQVVVVQDTESWKVEVDLPLEELLPQCLWLATAPESRTPFHHQSDDYETSISNNGDEQAYVSPRTPEEVPWGNW
jgi:hypothetical protein